MTETEWLTCTDPTPMLEFLRGKATDRKLRLLACACCRRIWHRFRDQRSRQAVEIAEQYADEPNSHELRSALSQASVAALSVMSDSHLDESDRVSGYAAHHAAYPSDPNQFAGFAWHAVALAISPSNRMMRAAASKLCRDIFGNPFRPVSIASCWVTWNGGTVAKLAAGVYEQRKFEDLPILADALEDSGCADASLLEHLRGPGPHVRGCWAIDLLLGKE